MIRRYRTSIAVGSILSCGFGVLAILWFMRGIWLTDPPAHLKGLFAYPSAYLGDSLLIPAAVALTLAGASQLPRTSRDRMLAAFAAALAGLLAIGTQFLWLIDRNPETNWTFPEPHRFNIAGVWHAMWFVAASATLMFAITLLSCRISAALRGNVRNTAVAMLRSAGPSFALAALFTYAVLATRDSLASTFSARSSLLAIGTAAVALLLLATLVLRRSIVLLAPHWVLAMGAAVAVTMAVSAPWSAERTQILGEASSALVGIGLMLLSLSPGRELPADSYLDYRPNPAQVLLGGTILVVLLPSFWAYTSAAVVQLRWTDAVLWLLGYSATITIILLVLVRQNRLGWLRQAADVMLVSVAFCTIALAALTVPHWQQAADLGPLVSVLVGAAISMLLFPILKVRMQLEISDESAPADEHGSFGLAGAAKLSATATVGMLLVFGLAGAVSLLAFTLAAAIDRVYVADSGAMRQIWPLVATGAALVLITTVLVRLRIQWLTEPLRALAPLLALGWPVALIVVVGIRGTPPVTAVAIAGGVVLALWSVDTMVNNIGTLRGGGVDGPLWAATGAVAVSGFFSGFIASSAALAASSSHVYTWFAGLSAATAILLVNGAMTVAIGHLSSTPDRGGTRHGMSHNLVQDSILVFMLYTITLVIPATTLLHLPPDLGVWARLIATFAIVGPFLAYFLRPYEWLLELNLQHVSREITTRAEEEHVTRTAVNSERGLLRRNVVIVRAANGTLDGPPQHRFLRALNAHVRNQSTMSNTLLLISLVGFVILLGGKSTAAFAYMRRSQDADQH